MKQIHELVKNLNTKFTQYSSTAKDVKDCLRRIAEITPYRYLSTFSHTLAAVQYQNEEDKKKANSKSKFFTPLVKSSSSSSAAAAAAAAAPPPPPPSTPSRTMNEQTARTASASGTLSGEDSNDEENSVDEPEANRAPDDLDLMDTHLPYDEPNPSHKIKNNKTTATRAQDTARTTATTTTTTTTTSSSPPPPPPPPLKEPVPDSWEKHYLEFPDHLKYFQKIRVAQQKSNETGKRVQVCWRGYRTSLPPNDGKIKKYELLQRLITALKNIRILKPNEKNVSLIIASLFKPIINTLFFSTVFD